MIEVYRDLWVGDAQDYESLGEEESGWSILHACKEPYHRNAVGYVSIRAPREDPEYLIARRGHRMMINLIDAPDKALIRKPVIDAALHFVLDKHLHGKVLIHCNRGHSRAPILAMLYLAKLLPERFNQAEMVMAGIYEPYEPGKGMRDFAEENWGHYHGC